MERVSFLEKGAMRGIVSYCVGEEWFRFQV